jgi:hypothetical protein
MLEMSLTAMSMVVAAVVMCSVFSEKVMTGCSANAIVTGPLLTFIVSISPLAARAKQVMRASRHNSRQRRRVHFLFMGKYFKMNNSLL